jgi:hypothetical protein
MMPTNWLEKNAGRTLITLSDADKDVAVSIYISMPDNQKEVMQAIEEHFIKDMWLCESMLLNDKQCGEKVKNDLYAMFESAIQDDIDRYMAPAPQTVTDQLMFDAGHKWSDF